MQPKLLRPRQLRAFRPSNLGRHARKAAQIMEERGWARGVEETINGEVCLTGAMRRATRPMGKDVSSYLVALFNDHFGWWMQEHMAAQPEDGVKVDCGNGEEAFLTFRQPRAATTWNDCIFQSKEETLAWLNKYADDIDPRC